jgi:hypothetical protein
VFTGVILLVGLAVIVGVLVWVGVDVTDGAGVGGSAIEPCTPKARYRSPQRRTLSPRSL